MSIPRKLRRAISIVSCAVEPCTDLLSRRADIPIVGWVEQSKSPWKIEHPTCLARHLWVNFITNISSFSFLFNRFVWIAVWITRHIVPCAWHHSLNNTEITWISITSRIRPCFHCRGEMWHASLSWRWSVLFRKCLPSDNCKSWNVSRPSPYSYAQLHFQVFRVRSLSTSHATVSWFGEQSRVVHVSSA